MGRRLAALPRLQLVVPPGGAAGVDRQPAGAAAAHAESHFRRPGVCPTDRLPLNSYQSSEVLNYLFDKNLLNFVCIDLNGSKTATAFYCEDIAIVIFVENKTL